MGFIVKAVKSVVKTVVGIVSKVVGAVFGFIVGGGSKKKTKTVSNLNKTLDPEAARKIAFGRINAPLDVRYWEVYGTNANQFDEVLAFATHRINAVKELYLEQTLAIDAAGTVQAQFVGTLSRAYKLGVPGQTALSVGGGSQWNASSTFDGVAHAVFKWLPDEKKLPNGIPSRYTQVIEGAPVYDPRRDSTVAGGSGSHRITDQTTWDYAAVDANGQPIGRNNALQALWYLIGWRIPTKNGAGTVTGDYLVAGRGIDPQDINLATFVAGANACEAAGYYTDLVLSTEDDHTTNEDKITCEGLIGRLIDPGGLWSYYANVNDTANVAVFLTDSDILDGVSVSWSEYKGMSEQFNQVGGKFINASAITLYQPFPYPLVRDATYETNLGVKRRKTQDYEQVLDYQLAQRLSRLKLNEGQYQGEFQAGFLPRALRAQAWDVVSYTSERFGWTKLFRVWRHDISTDGGIGMLLKEIHSSIWSAGTVNNALPAAAGTPYNPAQQIPLVGLAAAQQAISGPGTNPTIVDAASVSWTAPPENVRRTEVHYRVQGTTYWETISPIMRGSNTALLFPLVRGATYEIEARHISINEVPGAWVAVTPFVAGTAGNITYAGVLAATGADVNGGLRDSAVLGTPVVPRIDVLTALGTASSIAGQGALATLNAVDMSTSQVTNKSLANLDATAASKLATISPNAGSPVTFTIGGSDAARVSVSGNNYTKNTSGGDNTNGWAVGTVSYTGNAILSFRHSSTADHNIAGLCSVDPPTNGLTSMAYGVLVYFNLFVYEIYNGVTTQIVGQTGANGDLFQVTYDNAFGRIYKNGVQIGTSRQLPTGQKYKPLFSGFHGTMSEIAWAPFYTAADVNSNIIDTNGATFVTVPRNEIKTPLGIASAIAGQGALATQNSLSFGGAYLVGFGALAGLASVDLASTQVTNKSLANLDTAANIKLSGIQTGATKFVPDRAINLNSSMEDWITTAAPTGWLNNYDGTRTTAIVREGSSAAASANSTRGSSVILLPPQSAVRTDPAFYIPVTPGETIWLSWRFKTGAAGNYYIGAETISTSGAAIGPAYITPTGSVGGGAIFAGAAATVYTGTNSFVVPAGIYRIRLICVNDTVSGANAILDYFEIHRDQPGADITAQQQIVVSPYPALTTLINADSSGVIPSGTLPITMPIPTVGRNGIGVSADDLTTYSIVSSLPGCTATVDNTNGSASKGQVTIPTGLTGSGSYVLSIFYNGLLVATLKVAINVVNSAPASTGGTGSTSANFPVNNNITTGTSPGAQVGSTVTVSVASGQRIYGTFGGNYDVSGLSHAGAAVMRWRYSPAGANTWTDFVAGTSVTGGTAISDADYNQSPASITCNQDVGPAAGNYDVQLIGYKTGTGNILLVSHSNTAYVSVH